MKEFVDYCWVHYIYGLKDPRTLNIRYVGVTIHPKSRLIQHLNNPHSINMKLWIEELKQQNQVPELVILKTCSSRKWVDMEYYYISTYYSESLLNNMSE